MPYHNAVADSVSRQRAKAIGTVFPNMPPSAAARQAAKRPRFPRAGKPSPALLTLSREPAAHTGATGRARG